MKAIQYICAIVVLSALMGCGTVVTVQSSVKDGENIKPYSGTRLGIEHPFLAGHGVFVPLLLDVPFSFVADTLVLPVVLFQTTPITKECHYEQDAVGGEGQYFRVALTLRDQDISKIVYERSTEVAGMHGIYRSCLFGMLSNDKNSKWERKDDLTVIEFGNKTPRSQMKIKRIQDGYRVDFTQVEATDLCSEREVHPKTIEIVSGHPVCLMFR